MILLFGGKDSLEMKVEIGCLKGIDVDGISITERDSSEFTLF